MLLITVERKSIGRDAASRSRSKSRNVDRARECRKDDPQREETAHGGVRNVYSRFCVPRQKYVSIEKRYFTRYVTISTDCRDAFGFQSCETESRL